MSFRTDYIQNLITTTSANFEQKALELFRYQARENKVYAEYIKLLGRDLEKVKKLEEIPFLPISFFKTHEIVSGNFKPAQIFQSSGTTGQERSKHYVADPDWYHMVAATHFEKRYGSLKDFVIVALLPSYQENNQSSLIDMVEDFMKRSQRAENAYFIEDWTALERKLVSLAGNRILFLGVTYALLDYCEAGGKVPVSKDLIIMETGGMKGRREELIRAEVHDKLCKTWGIEVIHSEYGMTELLSQAYSSGKGVFTTSNLMKVLVREVSDPLSVKNEGSGGINVIDLANIDSCAFIETGDQGRVAVDGSFEILGRLDNSEQRGCNLLYVQ